MYRFDIIAVGKQPADFTKDGCAEFIKRLSPYALVNIEELPHSRLSAETEQDISNAIAAEQEKILALIPKNAVVAAMCIEGSQMSSGEFSGWIKECAGNGTSRFVFIIGGSHGLGSEVKRRADIRLSFSKMTFTHSFARMMLLEQLYRAVSIQNNLKYHK